jgi:hypothetical protein
MGKRQSEIQSGSENTGTTTTTNLSESLCQTCPTTNKYTNKSTNKQRGGLPLPAEGQAHAPLKDKQQKLQEIQEREDSSRRIEQLKRNFGSRGRRRKPKPTQAEFEQIKQTQLRTLKAVEAKEKGLEYKKI